MRAWQHYQEGHLLVAGGIADQPNRYLRAMEILGATIRRMRRHAQERQRQAPMRVHGAERMRRTKVI